MYLSERLCPVSWTRNLLRGLCSFSPPPSRVPPPTPFWWGVRWGVVWKEEKEGGGVPTLVWVLAGLGVWRGLMCCGTVDGGGLAEFEDALELHEVAHIALGFEFA
jgi:hypothetical protein